MPPPACGFTAYRSGYGSLRYLYSTAAIQPKIVATSGWTNLQQPGYVVGAIMELTSNCELHPAHRANSPQSVAHKTQQHRAISYVRSASKCRYILPGYTTTCSVSLWRHFAWLISADLPWYSQIAGILDGGMPCCALAGPTLNHANGGEHNYLVTSSMRKEPEEHQATSH